MYVCLSKKRYDPPLHYSLVSLRQEDMEHIRLWRNSQTAILRQNHPLSKEEQALYFTNVLLPSFSENEPRQILFTILHNEKLIGYGGLVHIDWQARRAEISFLLDTTIKEASAHFKECFLQFLQVLKEIAFTELKLHRLIAECFDLRCELMTDLAQFGFEKEGILQDHVFKSGRFHNSHLFALLAKENKSSEKANVLVTSIAKKVPLLSAVKDALQKSSIFSELYGADIDERVPGKYFVDHFWQCPPLNMLSIDALIDYCKRHFIKAIIPARDQELLFFAKEKKRLFEAGIQVMVSTLEAIELTADKKQFSDYLKTKKYPAIPTFITAEECASDRLVVKERTGSASQGLGLKLTVNEAIEYAKSLQEPIFQPYIHGQEYSVDLYVDQKSQVKGCVARMRSLVEHGESQITTTVSKTPLEWICTSIAADLAKNFGLYGHVMMQVIEDEKGAFFVVECNARFGGASTASVAVGLDSFHWFFLESQGATLEQYPFQRLACQVTQIRYPKDKQLYQNR